MFLEPLRLGGGDCETGFFGERGSAQVKGQADRVALSPRLHHGPLPARSLPQREGGLLG